MEDYLNQLQAIETKSQDGKIQKAKLEQKLATLQDEQKKIQEELKVQGVTEETLGSTIESLDKEIKGELIKCHEALK